MSGRLKAWPRTKLPTPDAQRPRRGPSTIAAGSQAEPGGQLVRGWVVVGLLVGTMAYAIAEEIILTTYYPSPRGVYNELRTAGNVQIGDINPPPVPDEAARLHVVQDQDSLFPSKYPAFRVDDTLGDASPFLIDKDGNVGIGTPAPGAKLDVVGTTRIYDSTPTTGVSTLTLRAGAGQATSPLLQWQNNAGTALGVIDASGNVGIGTVSPQAPAPNGTTTGNLDANDVYLRGVGKWASTVSATWGGEYVVGYWDGCGPANPLTGDCTCPAGFNSMLLGGFPGSFYLYVCWKP